MDFAAPVPDATAEEMERLFARVVLGVDEKHRRAQRAADAFVALDFHAPPISPVRLLSKIRASKGTAVVCWQGKAPFGLLRLRSEREESAFLKILSGGEGEMTAIFVPTFRWCVTRNHDTPPAALHHFKPDLPGPPDRTQDPDSLGARIDAIAARVAALSDR